MPLSYHALIVVLPDGVVIISYLGFIYNSALRAKCDDALFVTEFPVEPAVPLASVLL
jgi:hypothetical protein